MPGEQTVNHSGATSRKAWAALLILILVSSAAAVRCRAQGPLYTRPTDRFGVGVEPDFGPITDYDVASLHIGWYCNWDTSLTPLRPGGIEYAQLVSTHEGSPWPPLEELGPLVDANPGYLWILGNEPECIWQDDCTPQQYATVYHDLYAFIKGRDATAKIAIGGVVQPTPLRLKWLDQVLAHYQAAYGQAMPVDVWNMHIQILQEVRGSWGCGIPRGLTEDSGRMYDLSDNDNIDIFKQHIVDFRTWMRSRGQQNKPLIISEYGVLFPVQYGFSLERVNAFMNASFDYLLAARDDDLGYPADENRLVQRWLWYSLNDQPWDPLTGQGFNGALFDYRYREYPGVITPVGVNFKKYTDGLLAHRLYLPCVTGGVRRAAGANNLRRQMSGAHRAECLKGS